MSDRPDARVRRFLAALRSSCMRSCGRRPRVSTILCHALLCRFAGHRHRGVLLSVDGPTRKEQVAHPGHLERQRSGDVPGGTPGPRARPVRPTLGIIEENADRIIANTSDPAVRRGAMILKIEMTTTMLAAMLRSDPVLALADAWGYVLQVEDGLARPELQARYGQSAAQGLRSPRAGREAVPRLRRRRAGRSLR